MPVLVVAEHVGHRDLRAVDRRVVGHRDRVRDRLAERERLAARRASRVSSTTGGVLPTMTSTDAAAERPVRSVTRSVASKWPVSVYVNVGFGSRESTVPSESKSHAYVIRSPSGSSVPALENSTVSGGRPVSGSVGPSGLTTATFGIGVRLPRTKLNFASCASGFSLKNPSPYSRT